MGHVSWDHTRHVTLYCAVEVFVNKGGGLTQYGLMTADKLK